MGPWLTAFTEIRFPRLWMPMALYLPLAALLSGLSLYFHARPLTSVLALFGIGIFSWTLIEYFLHRCLFHEIKFPDPWRGLVSAFHLSHHQAVAAQEPDIVITRPAGSLPFAILFYFVFALLSLSFSAAALIEAGALLGYLFYECFHYSAHYFHPKNPVGAFLQRYHLQHHLQSPQRRFGVTSPLWDWVFGTYK